MSYVLSDQLVAEIIQLIDETPHGRVRKIAPMLDSELQQNIDSKNSKNNPKK